jgi:hypothetical protein
MDDTSGPLGSTRPRPFREVWASPWWARLYLVPEWGLHWPLFILRGTAFGILVVRAVLLVAIVIGAYQIYIDLGDREAERIRLNWQVIADGPAAGGNIGQRNALLFLMSKSVHLRGANLSGAYLEEFNFTGATLWWVDFSHANLRQVKFINANLENADFTGANVSLADFADATWLVSDALAQACMEPDRPPKNLQAGTKMPKLVQYGEPCPVRPSPPQEPWLSFEVFGQ